jgi:uncharacterized protein (TIGR00369 family)
MGTDAAPVAAGNFQQVLGIEVAEADPDHVVARCAITPQMHQPYGIVHGGVYCSIIESVASLAGAVWLGDEGQVVGVNNNTHFIRAISEGTLTATATPIQRGRTQQLWQVEIVDDRDKLIAHGQVRLANIRDKERFA